METSKNDSKPTILLFKKSDCKPCTRIAPELQKMVEKYRGEVPLCILCITIDSFCHILKHTLLNHILRFKVDFFEMKADTSKETLSILKSEGVRTVPTFQVYVNGEKVERVQGAHLDKVETIIKNLGIKKWTETSLIDRVLNWMSQLMVYIYFKMAFTVAQKLCKNCLFSLLYFCFLPLLLLLPLRYLWGCYNFMSIEEVNDRSIVFTNLWNVLLNG